VGAIETTRARLGTEIHEIEKVRQARLEEERRRLEIEQTARAIAAHIDAEDPEEARRALGVAEKLYGTGEPFVSLRHRLNRMIEGLARAEAARLRESADSLMSEHRYQEAVEELHRALEIAPQHSKTMRALAIAKKALQDQQTEQRRRRLLKERLDGVARLVAAGRFDSAERRLAALEADQQDEETEAARASLVEAREELRERQGEAFNHLQEARALAEEHAFGEARERLEQARTFAAELAEVHQLVGETSELIQRLEKEHRRAAEVIRVAESIRSHLESGKLDEAEHELEVAQRLYGKREALTLLQTRLAEARDQERNETVERLMREALTQQSSFEQIIATLEKALVLDPANETVQRLLAESRSSLHRYEQEQRSQRITATMKEVDELIVAGNLKAARETIEAVVDEIGDFKDARLVRFRLARLLADPKLNTTASR
jgi:tetratricopeptide (TPR) repeat protein